MGVKHLRILLADDHTILREGLRALIESNPDMEIVGEAEDGQKAVRLAQTLKPDIAILDISMPDLNGIEAARQMLKMVPGIKIIALSMHSDKRFVTGMLRAGASGYVLKECAFEELVSSIRAVAKKGTYLSPRIAGGVVKEYLNRATPDAASGFSLLTDRQREVLQMIAEGRSTKHIAFQLKISTKTAEAHIQNIMQRLDIHSIAELTKYAIKEGLTSL